MMQIVTTEHQFTQAQAAECTSADVRTIENYINYGYLKPALIGGRRRLSLRQLVRVEFIYRLATVCRIGPKNGSRLVEQIVAEDRFGLKEDAAAIDAAAGWPAATGDRLQLIFDADNPDAVALVPRFVPESLGAAANTIHLVFPARLFSRIVLQRAAKVVSTEPAEQVAS